MNANEKRSRLEDIKHSQLERKLTLAEYHEALELCEDLGLDTAWRNFKRMLERQNSTAQEKGNEKMTEQEQKQVLSEATLLAEGTPMEVSAHEDTSADYAARTFNTRRGVAIWFGHEIICVLDSVARWNAFKSVASIITDGSRTAAQDEYYVSHQQ